MTLLRQYRFASFLLVILSIVAFSIAEVDLGLLFTGVVLAVLSWYVTEGPRGRTLPDWAANTLVVGLIAWSAFDFLVDVDLSEAMGALGRFLLWLLLVKLFARRVPSEERQRLSLSAMLVIAGCLQSVDFVFGALVVLYVGVATWTAMLWRLSRSADAARASRIATSGFAPPLEIAVGRRTLPQFRGLATTSILGILAAGVVLFIAFPRFAEIGGRLPGMRGNVSGFSPEIRLRGGERITESRRELFTVRWIDARGMPGPALRPLLLRGAVLDWYDPEGRRWIPRRGAVGVRTLRTEGDGTFAGLARGRTGPVGPSARAEIAMRGYASEVIFSTYAPVAVATAEPRSISIDPATLILQDVSTDRVGRYSSYAIEIQPQPTPELLEALSSPAAARDRHLDLPLPEMREIALGIVGEASRSTVMPPELAPGATDAERWIWGREVARAIAGWMKSTFTYTTDLSGLVRVGNEDPIVSFLTRYRSGHCEYFASALCAVLRSLGIESRIVTGFIAIEYDEGAGHYVVRESNAHAWVEVRTGPAAWTSVDATPEETLLALSEENRSWADGFRWIYGRLEFLWNARVVSYDASVQATIAGQLREGWRENVGARLSRALSEAQALATSLSLGRAGGAWFAAIAVGGSTSLLAVLLALLRRRRRRRTLHLESLPPAEQRRLLAEGSFYADALDALEAAGLGKPFHRTPRAHAEALRATHREIGERFGMVAEAFYAVRYGGGGASVGGLGAGDARRRAVAELKALLRRKSRPDRAD